MRGDVPVTQTVTQMFAKFSPHARGCSCAPCPPARNTIVFPACAGMFLQRKCQSSVPLSFPRMRGDVPAIRQRLDAGWRFSPHARGCSETAYFPISPNHVFPACAGMFRIHSLSCKRRFSFPRMRGDVPVCLAAALTSLSFSPHARGCSDPQLPHRTHPDCFPRMRGDVPDYTWQYFSLMKFSPHARGCSAVKEDPYASSGVFPACAGMFRKALVRYENSIGFPRMRGDVPL